MLNKHIEKKYIKFLTLIAIKLKYKTIFFQFHHVAARKD